MDRDGGRGRGERHDWNILTVTSPKQSGIVEAILQIYHERKLELPMSFLVLPGTPIITDIPFLSFPFPLPSQKRSSHVRSNPH